MFAYTDCGRIVVLGMPRSKTYADVLDPTNAHRMGLHQGTFTPGCSMCHLDDRLGSSKSVSADKSRREHSDAIRWVGAIRPLKYQIQRTISCVTNLSFESVAKYHKRCGWMNTLMMRDAFNSFVHEGGLDRLHIPLRVHAITYFVVAHVQETTPIIYHSKCRELITLFACALQDGFSGERYELLQKLFMGVDLHDAVHADEENTNKVVVMYFSALPFHNWTDVAFTIHTGRITNENGKTVLLDGGYDSCVVDSTHPNKLVNMGPVDLASIDPDALQERAKFAEHTRTVDIDEIPDSVCEDCTRLKTVVSHLQTQRNRLSVQNKAGVTTHELESDVPSFSQHEQRKTNQQLFCTEIYDLENEVQLLRVQLSRSNAELELLRADDTDNRKLKARSEELQRQSSVIKQERCVERETHRSLRQASKQQMTVLEQKLETISLLNTDLSTEISKIRRVNTALCSDTENSQLELDRARVDLVSVRTQLTNCVSELNTATEMEGVKHSEMECAKSQLLILREQLACCKSHKHETVHPETTCEHIRHAAEDIIRTPPTPTMVTQSTSTYVDTKGGSVDLEPGIIERHDKIAELETLLEASKALSRQLQENATTCQRPTLSKEITQCKSQVELQCEMQISKARIHGELEKLIILASVSDIKQPCKDQTAEVLQQIQTQAIALHMQQQHQLQCRQLPQSQPLYPYTHKHGTIRGPQYSAGHTGF